MLDLAETDPQLQALMPLAEASAPCRADRKPSYQEVVEAIMQRFEAKLRALPEEKRQRGVLPVIASVWAPMKVAQGDGDRIDSAAFVEAVRHLPMRNVPQLDRALLLKYLSDLRLLGPSLRSPCPKPCEVRDRPRP